MEELQEAFRSRVHRELLISSETSKHFASLKIVIRRSLAAPRPKGCTTASRASEVSQ